MRTIYIPQFLMSPDGAPAAGGAPAAAAPPASASAALAPSVPAPAAPAAAPASHGAGPAAGGAPIQVTPQGGAAAGGNAPAADWLNGMDDATKAFATNKGWKNPSELLGSYQNLEKLVGAPADKIVKLPAADDADGWKAVHAKLGCPQTAKEYGFNDDPAKGGNPDFAKWAGENFQKLGLSVKQGQELAAGFEKYAEGLKAAQDQAQIAQLQEGQKGLQKEWGAAYDQNVQIAKRGAAVMGVDKATLDKIENAIGFDGVMKLFHSMGAKTGEASFVPGSPGNGALTPAAAAERINALKADPGFVKRYTEGDAAARQEMQRLHEMMSPGETSLR